jgi:hypothetical protein
MQPPLIAAALLLWMGFAGGARAESMKCGGTILGEGESKLAVLRACGEPAFKDAYCKPVIAVSPGYPGGVVVQGAPCVLAEEWLYERGDGNLPVTVRFELGTVQSIRYGQAGRRN